MIEDVDIPCMKDFGTSSTCKAKEAHVCSQPGKNMSICQKIYDILIGPKARLGLFVHQ